MAGSKLSPFVLRPELYNLLIDLELSDTQRLVAITMYMLAEPNGVLEKNPPGLVRQAGTGKLGDVSLVYDILENAGVIEYFSLSQATNNNKRIVFDYIYLSNYLDEQWHNTKSRLPSPPWVTFQPHITKAGEKDWSKGHYIDTRKQNLFQHQIEERPLLDRNPHAELNGSELNIERKESANASKKDEKTKEIDKSKTSYERMEFALKEVLDGSNGIRKSLEGKTVTAQKLMILCQLKGRPYLGIADIRPDFDIEPDGNDWKPYQRTNGKTV